jgi:hypothetical protein
MVKQNQKTRKQQQKNRRVKHLKTRRGGGGCFGKLCQTNKPKVEEPGSAEQQQAVSGTVPTRRNPMHGNPGAGTGLTTVPPRNAEFIAFSKQAYDDNYDSYDNYLDMWGLTNTIKNREQYKKYIQGQRNINSQIAAFSKSLELGPGDEAKNMNANTAAFYQEMKNLENKQKMRLNEIAMEKFKKSYNSCTKREQSEIDADYEYENLPTQGGGGGCFGGLCSGNKSSVNENAHQTPTKATGAGATTRPMTQNPMTKTKKPVTIESLTELIERGIQKNKDIMIDIQNAEKDVSKAQSNVDKWNEQVTQLKAMLENLNQQPDSEEKQEKITKYSDMIKQRDELILNLIPQIAEKQKAIAVYKAKALEIDINIRDLEVVKINLKGKARREQRNAERAAKAAAGTGLQTSKGGKRNRKQKTKKNNKRN